MKLTIYNLLRHRISKYVQHDLFLLVLVFGLFCGFCNISRADSFNTAAALPYPSESGTGSFSSLNIMPQVLIDSEKYIDQTDETQLVPSREADNLYLPNTTQSGRRNSIFQKLSCSALWMPDSGSKGLGLVQSDISAAFAFPCISKKLPLIITPSFSHKRFDRKSADALDFYDTGVDFRLLFPVIDEKLLIDAGFSARYSGMFEGSSSKSMRYPARVAAIWSLNPRLKMIFGVAYLDRNDEYNWLPVGGLIWTPNPDVNVELLFPMMRIARRLRCFDQWDRSSKRDFTRWIYGAFELGGGSWNYVNNGRNYEVEYRDFRFLVGYEHRCAGGTTFGVETGCAIGRKMEFQGLPDYKPDTAFFIRLKLSL
ncbi:MAG: hypothetical protein LBL39_05105 [Planctomycetaceae bacterium]|jgi:hypothetical protein|nr:hypothetical protein [Planctomycetaceae bacterium]